MKVFIGCSSSDKLDSIYYDSARDVASFLANKNYDLLIGGVRGIMGVVSSSFAVKGREVSVMEVDCYRDEADNCGYSVYEHKLLYLRKNDLITKASLIVFLPGGIGTFDEIFTAIESKRAYGYDKNIVILNINGYYDNLIRVFDNMYDNKFADLDNKKLFVVINSIEEFYKYIDSKDW